MKARSMLGPCAGLPSCSDKRRFRLRSINFTLRNILVGPDFGVGPSGARTALNQSACVLIIGSEGWFSAYEKNRFTPGLGLGAATEADLFRQALWDEQGNNTRIRLAFLHNLSIQQVPVRLRAWHQFPAIR